MNAFKRKSLYTAVVAGLGALGASQASAVNINPDGTGEVLLYPYYTVRNGFITSFSVVNTNTSHTKAAKVRFLEGKNSAEVLDFNLFLSPRDVWTGQISDNGTGGVLTTTDRSCTAPAIPAAGQPFSNAYYTGALIVPPADSGGASLDRTREGYIEIIEMGVVANGVDAASSPATVLGTTIATAVKHGSTGIPANCAVIQVDGLLGGAGNPTNGSDMREPVGGLTGNGIIINAASGTEFAYTPIALDNFFNPIFSASLYFDPGQVSPQLSNAFPFRSDVFVATAGTPAVLTVSDWGAAPSSSTSGIDAVSAVLMRSAIINEYDISPNFKTDWVVTQPTKRAYVFPVAVPIGPFANLFTGTAPNATSCDPVLVTGYDREEAPYFQTTGISFSPRPAGSVAGFGNICYEATVITIAPFGVVPPAVNTASGSSIFGSVNNGFINLPANGTTGTPPAPNYTAGWIGLYPTATTSTPVGSNHPGQFMSGGGSLAVTTTLLASGGLRGALQVHSDAVARRYRGLPVIGFQATQALLSGQGYGGIFAHKFNRTISAP